MKSQKRNITVITGTRADYGILRPVLEAISTQPKLNLQVLITGQHMLARFGSTYKEVVNDGWPVIGKVRLQSSRYDIASDAIGMGRAISQFSRIFHDISSDIVVVLGDRLEQFAAASAAIASGKFLAHIHGGDRATGITDDSFRHAMTKLSHIHFAASDESAKRIQMLGEDNFRIYRTGSPAIDGIKKNICKNIVTLQQHVSTNLKNDFLIIMLHPSGGSDLQEQKQMAELLDVCSCKPLNKIVLYPNCDPGHAGIIKAINNCLGRPDFEIVTHLPRSIYLGLLNRSVGLIGNSSGGIVEASSLNVDVLDVGNRQAGRQRSCRVLHCDFGRNNIAKAVDQLIAISKEKKGRPVSDIYGRGNSGRKIASVLAGIKLDDCLRLKTITY